MLDGGIVGKEKSDIGRVNFFVRKADEEDEISC